MPLQIPFDLEANAEHIVQAVGKESIEVYRFLRQRYTVQDPQSDPVFQFMFRSFYRIDNAGLTDDFKTRFFQLLSAARESHQVDVEDVVLDLFEIPNRKGQSSLQFSFATKLAATVDSSVPIYDAEVASIFGFRPPYNYKPFPQRLTDYMSFYVQLTALYRSIIEGDLLAPARLMFRTMYDTNEAEVSETKVLDFIFWSAGKLSRE
jgi:hypothetical protein